MRYQVSAVNILLIAGCALWAGLATASEPSPPSDDHVAETRDIRRSATNHATTAREAAYGRAVIYRAGEMPRSRPKKEAMENAPPRKSSRPTHYLDTTLPVIIQGAPQRMALERHLSTG